MSDLIDALKKDHIVILVLLRKLKNKDLTTGEISAYFSTIKSLINRHFELEDDKLYPDMIQMSNEKNNANKIVEEFTVGLDKIAKIISDFFETNENDLKNINKNSDYNKIITLLEVRINKEEKSLYPLYNKIISQ